MPSILGYWKLRGLGQPVQLLLEYAGEEYQLIRYDQFDNPDQWFKQDKLNNVHQLAFPNLPYYVSDQVKMTQSWAIVRHLARKYGLAGTTEQEICQLEVLDAQLEDIRDSFVNHCYSSKEDFENKLDDYKNSARASVDSLSTYLGDKTWLTGERVTYVDLLLYFVLFDMKAFDPDLVSARNLTDLLTRVEALPRIAGFMESDRYISWPFCLPEASWGGQKQRPAA